MGILFFIVCLLFVSLTSCADVCKSGSKCITLKSCAGIYHQVQQRNEIMMKLLRSLQCGFNEDGIDMICCPPEYLISKDTDIDQNKVSLLPNISNCGIQNRDRIVGGSQTDLDEHPWMALLRYDKPQGHGFYCGGVLVSSRYVLTAAHCVKGADLPPTWKLSQVRLGEWNVTSKNDCYKGECIPAVVDVPIEEVIAHESYSPGDGNQLNDIALIRLSRSLPVTDFVKPICLPITADLRTSDYEGSNAEVAGWGKTELRSSSEVKLKVRLPVIARKNCERVYKKANRVITENQLCAGGLDGQDSCRGDSGGPLMAEIASTQNWVAIGVVSYGPSPCGTENWPGVYTRVSAYMDWILSKIRP